MDLSEFEWVDDKEWEALEEAMTAAVQQREAQRRHGIANSSFENAKAGSQASFLEPSPVFERSKVDWASVQVTRAPPCSVVEGHSAEPSQPEWPEAMSLSEWVPSQRGFPGFWPECTTAGAESLTAGKPIVSAGENCAAAEEGHVRTDTDCATAVMEQLQNRRGGELGSVPQEPSGLSPSGRTNGPESKATHLEEMAGTAPLPAPATESFETVKPLPEPSLSVQPPLKVCTSTASPSEPPNTSGDQTVPDCGQGERHSARQLPAWLTPARAAAPPQDCTLPIMRFGGRIVYAVSPQEVECTARTMLEDLRGGEACLGFDIEWKVTFRRGEEFESSKLHQNQSWQGRQIVTGITLSKSADLLANSGKWAYNLLSDYTQKGL